MPEWDEKARGCRSTQVRTSAKLNQRRRCQDGANALGIRDPLRED